MGIAKIYNQKQSGIAINGIIQDYYAYAGENISAGDFVEFINGVAGQTTETSVDTLISGDSCEGEAISATKLDDTRVFIAHGSGASGSLYLYGIVCSIKGSEIIIGTDTWLIPEMYSGDRVAAVTLDENRVFIAHCYGNNRFLYGMVCKISGTTIETIGTDTKIREYSSAGSTISAMLLDTDKIFIGHGLNTTKLHGIICSVSNTTIAIGTDTQLSSANGTYNAIAPIKLSIDKIFIAHSQANDYLYSMICTVSGTTLTAVSPTALSNTSQAGSRISPELLPNGNIFIAHSYAYNSSYSLYGMVVIVNGTTITAGTDVQLDSSNYSGYTISTELLPSGKVFIAHSYGGDTKYYLYGMVVTISGTTITAGADTPLNTADKTGYTISSVVLDNGTIFLAHSYPYNSSNLWCYAQIWGIDEANNIPTNNVTIKEYETQVRKATTSDIYGVAKTSGMGAYRVVEYTIPEGESVSGGEERDFDVLETLISGDIIPKTWTDLSGSNINKEYVAEDGTKIFSWGGVPSNAFDGNTGSYWRGYATASKDNHIGIIFTKPKKITKLKTHIKEAYGTPCLIQGSKDGIEWVTLKSFGSTQTSLVEITLDNPDFYSQYKICFPNEVSALPEVYEVQVSEYIGFAPTKGIALQSGTSGDTIQIAVPVTDEESTGHKDIVSVYTALYEYRTFTTDAVPKTWTVVTEGTSYVSSNGTKLTASECHPYSSSADTDYSVSYVCDGNVSKRWQTSSTSAPCWVQLEFPKPIKITKMKTYVDSFYDIKSCVIQGSNDGVNWVDLYTLSSAQTALTEITLTITMEAKYYRIYATKSSHNTTPWIYEWQVSEWIGLVEKQKGGV